MEGGNEGGGGGAERGASISLSDDKLTLGKMYVMSHQSQLIKSLAAPSSFLCPSLPTQTEELRLKAQKTKHSQKEIRISDGFKGFLRFASQIPLSQDERERNFEKII